MKRPLKLLILVIVLAISLPFVLRGKDGRPLMKSLYFTAPKVAVPDLSAAEAKAREAFDKVQRQIREARDEVSAALPDATDVSPSGPIYKWRDAKGAWVFSDRPNPAGESLPVEVNPQANIIPAPRNEPRQVEPAAAKKPEDAGLPLPSLTSVPLSEIPRLIEDARAVQELVDARYNSAETGDGEGSRR